MTYLGITWDHPRGCDALVEVSRRVNATRAHPLIAWHTQPLEGFESEPICVLADTYDLIVLDHPHIGEAVAKNCLIPLEDLFPQSKIADWKSRSVGASMSSYGWAGRHWAVPLDVATQVMARRPDLVADPPTDWNTVAEIAVSGRVALSLGGPHALLNLFSILASQGIQPGGEELLPQQPAVEALMLINSLAAEAPPGSHDLNPIQLLEWMCKTDDIALVPLVFGYATYAHSDRGARRLAFSDTIGVETGFGGVMGGAGIGVSRRAAPNQDLLDLIDWLMSDDCQRALLPEFGGQPSARSAWQDAAVNAASGNFYVDTLTTAERAMLRPRFAGYVRFQNEAARIIRAAIAAGDDELRTFQAIRSLWDGALERLKHDADILREDRR